MNLRTECDPELQKQLLKENKVSKEWMDDVNVQVITYNVSGKVPKDKEKIRGLVYPKPRPECIEESV